MRKLLHNRIHAIKPNDKEKIQKAPFTYINDNRPCKKERTKAYFLVKIVEYEMFCSTYDLTCKVLKPLRVVLKQNTYSFV